MGWERNLHQDKNPLLPKFCCWQQSASKRSCCAKTGTYLLVLTLRNICVQYWMCTTGVVMMSWKTLSESHVLAVMSVLSVPHPIHFVNSIPKK